MRNFIIILFAIGLLSSSLSAAPLFTDTSNDHWAYEALSTLTSKGIIEGYPDGTYRGERALSRWELALALSRLLALQEMQCANFLGKEELETIRTLATEYQSELEAFGVRVADLESKLPALEERTASLEKIKFYGSFDTLAITQGAVGSGSRVPPFVLEPQRDWFSGVVLPNGVGVSALGILGVNAAPCSKYRFGAEFAAFFSQGDEMVNLLWGVTAPYQSNAFTMGQTFTPLGANLTNVQSFNTVPPWTKMTLDNLWMEDQNGNHKLIYGSFRPDSMARIILTPISNPNFNLPMDLPFYGIKYRGKFFEKLSAEFIFSQLPEALEDPLSNNVYRTYQSWVTGIDLTYPLTFGKIGLHYARTVNEDHFNGAFQGQGAMPLPFNIIDDNGTRSYLVQWQDVNGAAHTWVGPQSQDSFALTLKGDLGPSATYALEAAQTQYRPDTSTAVLGNISQTAAAYHLEIGANINKLGLVGEYLSISPYFDPFIIRYPVMTGNVNLPPYASYFSNYYQMHDSQTYPNNREGFRLKAKYPFKKLELNLTYEGLTQRENTPGPAGGTQNGCAGFIEPLFLVASPAKGNINDYSIGFNYNLSDKWLANGSFTRYNIARKTTMGTNDYMDLNIDLSSLALGYKLNEKFSLAGSYGWFSFSGDYGAAPQNFRQYIPAVSANYAMDANTNCSLIYRLFTYNNLNTANKDWNGNQLMLELKTKF